MPNITEQRNTPEAEQDDTSRINDQVRGVADEGEDEFEETDDMEDDDADDSEEVEEDGSF